MGKKEEKKIMQLLERTMILKKLLKITQTKERKEMIKKKKWKKKKFCFEWVK